MIKFYSYDALIRCQVDELFRSRFAISNVTYEKILDSSINADLILNLMTRRDAYDICYNIKGPISETAIPQEVYIATQYDALCHPDEVVFVTTDEQIAQKANLYFGSDSIQLMKG